MTERLLYKYLDIEGGLAMLKHNNLQFTNATKLNDPFDCHPALIDYSNVPEKITGEYRSYLPKIRESRSEQNRQKTWICSLSKVHNSLLMWAYYGNHQGVCVGINMDKAKPYLDNIQCSVFRGAQELEVQYKNVIERPDYFHERIDYYHYQYATKAKDWEHEQEVRLLLIDPIQAFVPMALPYTPKDNKQLIDWKEVRAYPQIGWECFDTLYLGIKIDNEKKVEIIKSALTTNPE